jgi:ClpP class serine protease
MWLIHESSIEEMLEAKRVAESLTAKDREAYEARFATQSDANPEIYRVVGDTANVQISGVLTKHFSYIYSLFGGGSTGYADIISSIALAEQDDSVKQIQLNISSGGGAVDGVLDAFDAIKNANKPVVAVVSGVAASAAYLLASAADKILATSATDMFGSVGVVQSYFVSDYRVEITNTESPDKRPDVTTEEGRKAVQRQLDPIHDLLVENISEGRTAATGKEIDAQIINSNFGKGAVFIAKEAISRSMIDGLVESSEKVGDNENLNTEKASAEATKTDKETGVQPMNKSELQSKHPEVYQAIVAEGEAKGVEAGVEQERQRVMGHIAAAKGSGLTDKAFEAIEKGDDMTEASRMEHLTASINKGKAGNMAGDNADLGSAATTEEEQPAAEDEVFEDLASDWTGENYA